MAAAASAVLAGNLLGCIDQTSRRPGDSGQQQSPLSPEDLARYDAAWAHHEAAEAAERVRTQAKLPEYKAFWLSINDPGRDWYDGYWRDREFVQSSYRTLLGTSRYVQSESAAKINETITIIRTKQYKNNPAVFAQYTLDEWLRICAEAQRNDWPDAGLR